MGYYREGTPYVGPLNPHYKDFVPVELAETSYLDKLRSYLQPANTAMREYAVIVGKKCSRRRYIRRRRKMKALCDSLMCSAPSKPHITQRNLDQSPFLWLPLELRQSIYEFFYTSYRTLKIQDLSYDGTYFLTGGHPCSESLPGRGSPGSIFNYLLGLPLTCRTIYPETIVYLYPKTEFRFTDPRLAVSIPETIPMRHLHSIQSLDLTFFLHVLVGYFKRSGVRAVSSRFDVGRPRYLQARKRKNWERLWSALATLSSLEKVSLWICQARDFPQLEMQPWMEQYILNPLLVFQEDKNISVDLDLCWRPEAPLFDALGLITKASLYGGGTQMQRYVTNRSRQR